MKSTLFGFVVLVFASCSTIYVTPGEFDHMICIDEQGAPADVRPRDVADDVVAHEAHVASIVTAFHRWQEQDRAKNRRMMLIIHGGLVSMSTAVKEAREAMAEMAKGEERFFPVFINWETDLAKSYWDHLTRVRQGERRQLTAIATSPFVLVYDFGRAIVRYPITLWSQCVNLRDYYYRTDGGIKKRPESWRNHAELDPAETDRTWVSTVGDAGLEVVPGALRLVTTPLLDGVGVSSFLNMRRRARMLIRRDEDFGQENENATGALSLLMHELLRRTKKRGDKRPIEMTMIGHSMGCIVANRVIREFGYRRHPLAKKTGDKKSDKTGGKTSGKTSDKTNGKTGGTRAFWFRDIVFMGAACTIREFADTTLQYVLNHDRQVDFYNLCLHPRDEEDDKYAMGVLPHGSLLEWIDDYITIQANEMDRTLGKWNNIARVLRVMDWITREQRDRIHVKGFARKTGSPRDHGDFNNVEFEFWKPAFWEPIKNPK